jgi:DNA-binding Xre family transcriptional regulator
MLYFNIKKVLRLRGVDEHYRFLVNLGFVPSTAHNFLRSDVTLVRLEQIEKLCVALNCTPNDLLEWQPNQNQTLAETHSMNKLKKRADKSLPELLGEIPIEKFEQIAEILQDSNDKTIV